MFPSHVGYRMLRTSRNDLNRGPGCLLPSLLVIILTVPTAAQEDARRHQMPSPDATRTANEVGEWDDDPRDESVDGSALDEDSTLDSEGIAGEDPPPEAPTTVDAVCFDGSTPTATLCSQHSECLSGQACRLKSRFLSIDPSPGVYALQITVTAVPNAPAAVNQPPYNYPNMVGDVWWVGSATLRTNDQMPYTTAPLQCTDTPLVQDWDALGPIHLYGDGVVSGARYEIRACLDVDGPCSEPLALSTTRSGDLRSLYNVTDFADVSAAVGEFQTPTSTATILKHHAWTQPSNMTQAMGSAYNMGQIAAVVTSFFGGAPHQPNLGANRCP